MELVSYRKRNSNPSAPTSRSTAASSVSSSNDGGDCGWYCWQPRCLRTFATSKSFLFWMCLAGGSQSFLINGLINVCVSTIERRFELTSVDSGFILGAFDIASFLTVLPISYFGSRKGACKPRWIGCGVFLLALGSFIYAIPHFVAGRYQAEMEKQLIGTCSSEPLHYSRNGTCSEHSLNGSNGFPLRDFRHIFFLSQFIMGIGGAPLYTLGPTYIDDNVSNKMQPIYTGILFASAAFGPALGYMAGGQLLRIYVDFPVLSSKDVGIVPGSSVWVGAWWLGFILIGIVLTITAIPLLAFPVELPGSKELAAAKEAELAGSPDTSTTRVIPKLNDPSDKAVSIGQSLREFPCAIKELARQWTFLFVCLEQACESLLVSGVAAFIPKIIESQFSLLPASAALIVGGLIIPCGCGGVYLGGYIIKRFQLEATSILKLSILLSGLSFSFSLTFAVNCPNQDFAGLTVPYSSELKFSGFDSSCNANCSCSMELYNPICGVDNIMYYSPCHAGCSGSFQVLSGELDKLNNTKAPSMTAYTQCSCISVPSVKRITVEHGLPIDVMAMRQKCKSPCTYQLYIFIFLLFLFFLLKFLNTMPLLSATLRSVPPSRRAFALGAQMIIWRLLGAIPGPILFGAFIDNSCLLWRQNEAHCGRIKDPGDKLGSCVFYDNRSFSNAILGVILIGKAVSFLFAFLAWWFYKSPITQDSAGAKVLSDEPHHQQSKFRESNACYVNSAMDSSNE